MKLPLALLLWMLIALLPIGAQAHAGHDASPCPAHAAAAAARDGTVALPAPARTEFAVAAATPAAHACHHDGAHHCRCSQACGSGGALALRLHSGLADHPARSELPPPAITVATRAPPPIDLLRPPTLTL